MKVNLMEVNEEILEEGEVMEVVVELLLLWETWAHGK
jgi:hypothetical protein